MLRLYGPLEPFFDKTWQPSEIELVQGAVSRRAGADTRALAAFQEALDRDGFDVSPGAVSIWNLAADWCASKPGVDSA
jgi:hypothetical protein